MHYHNSFLPSDWGPEFLTFSWGWCSIGSSKTTGSSYGMYGPNESRIAFVLLQYAFPPTNHQQQEGQHSSLPPASTSAFIDYYSSYYN